MADAMREVCDTAHAKSVRLLPSAEETNTLAMVDKWTLDLQRKYNRGSSGAIMYNTYQCYLKAAPENLAAHLADAQKEGYTLGVKLVRGAYLNSEARHLIWDTKEDTDKAYDSLTSAVLRRRYEGLVQPLSSSPESAFPEVNVVLATHNAATVRKAHEIRQQQVQSKEQLVPLAYAQLQGMADEVSCELLALGSDSADAPRVYKFTSFGTMKQCLNYLLRRAAENKDAASRTNDSRVAMGMELRRRFWSGLGVQ